MVWSVASSASSWRMASDESGVDAQPLEISGFARARQPDHQNDPLRRA